MRRFLGVVAIVLVAVLAGRVDSAQATHTVHYGNFQGGWNAAPLYNGQKGVRVDMSRTQAEWQVQDGVQGSAWIALLDGNSRFGIQIGYEKTINANSICPNSTGGVPHVFFELIDNNAPSNDFCLEGQSVSKGEEHILKVQRCSSGYWCGYVDNVEIFHSCGLYAPNQHFCSGFDTFGAGGQVQAMDEWGCNSNTTCDRTTTYQNVDATYGGSISGFGYVNWSTTQDGADCGCASWSTLSNSNTLILSRDEPDGHNWWFQNAVNTSTPWQVYWNR